MLRPDFVRRKLQLILDELDQLVGFRGLTLDELVGDPIRLAAVERMLERVVLRAIDINEHLLASLATGAEQRTTRLSYRDTFIGLAALGVYSEDFAARIARSAGLRNIIVHEYNDVDHGILHASIGPCLEQYHEYVKMVFSFLDRYD